MNPFQYVSSCTERELCHNKLTNESQHHFEKVSCMSFLSKLFSRGKKGCGTSKSVIERGALCGSEPITVEESFLLQKRALNHAVQTTINPRINYSGLNMQKPKCREHSTWRFENKHTRTGYILNQRKVKLRNKLRDEDNFDCKRHMNNFYQHQLNSWRTTCPNCQKTFERSIPLPENEFDPVDQTNPHSLSHNLQPASGCNSTHKHEHSTASVHHSLTDSGIFVGADSSFTEQRVKHETESPNFSHIPLSTEPPPSPAPPPGLVVPHAYSTTNPTYLTAPWTPILVNTNQPYNDLASYEPTVPPGVFPIFNMFQSVQTSSSSASLSSSTTASLNTQPTADDESSRNTSTPYPKDIFFPQSNVEIIESEGKIDRVCSTSQQHIRLLEQSFRAQTGRNITTVTVAKCVQNLRQNLIILAEAKKVINRQMELLRESYMEMTKGQLSSTSLYSIAASPPINEPKFGRCYSLQALQGSLPDVQHETEFNMLQNLFDLTLTS
ncbi:hypothetical protein CRM22_006836 [Opisthorchis felineus]|uniref:Uncharacterized protein n=1 Tax=Opisthorchis felineus TaxID=147828 RepID=A0A4S2LL22_OPIFE|nr:hypothetical protein CRM22_006836 [Opisthorchis felineus]